MSTKLMASPDVVQRFVKNTTGLPRERWWRQCRAVIVFARERSSKSAKWGRRNPTFEETQARGRISGDGLRSSPKSPTRRRSGLVLVLLTEFS